MPHTHCNFSGNAGYWNQTVKQTNRQTNRPKNLQNTGDSLHNLSNSCTGAHIFKFSGISLMDNSLCAKCIICNEWMIEWMNNRHFALSALCRLNDDAGEKCKRVNKKKFLVFIYLWYCTFQHDGDRCHSSALFVTDHRCTRTYTPSEDKEELSRICRDNICRCTQGKVPVHLGECMCIFVYSVCCLDFFKLFIISRWLLCL